MSTKTTITFNLLDTANQPIDVDQDGDGRYLIRLGDAAGTFGVQRLDDGTVVVPAAGPTPWMTRLRLGVYRFEFDDPTPGLTYRYFVAWTYNGRTRYTEQRRSAPPPAQTSVNPPAPDPDAIEPGISARDGCPVLRRVSAFVSQEGVATKLRFTFTNASDGTPLNLNGSFVDVSESASASATVPDETVLVKFREWTGGGTDPGCDDVHQVIGTIVDAVNGVVEARVPKAVYAQCGIYTVGWGYVRDGELRYVQQTVLSVERSLFGFAAPGNGPRTEGPPTLNEVRMRLMDSPGDNSLLMGDVEFADEQILQALALPVEYFNATNPPISQRFTTKNFPWRFAWLDGVKAYLFLAAADWYRRNRLQVTGGGKQLDDLNREQEYLRAAAMYEQKWQDFVLKKKVELNMAACVGSFGSDYGSGWWR